MRKSIAIAAALGLSAAASCAQEDRDVQAPAGGEPVYEPGPIERKLAEPPVPLKVEAPEVNARRGRILFVTRGCVICHAANGVGGKAAASLDAQTAGRTVNPLAFSAAMWRGASAMTALQAAELGYVIDLDAQDIADLAAFAASADEQSLLTPDSVPVEMRDWFINQRIWENEDWDDYLNRGGRIPKLEEPLEDQ
jgi:hypothetical protein